MEWRADVVEIRMAQLSGAGLSITTWLLNRVFIVFSRL